jgi:hypothetical protein
MKHPRVVRLEAFLVDGALWLVAELVVGLWAWAVGETWAALVCAGLGALVAVAWGLVWLAWWRARASQRWMRTRWMEDEHE